MTETMPSCRREEVALCNPHRSALTKLKLQPSPTVPEQLESSEKQCMSEKQVMSEKEFLRNHSLYSAASSWLFAIAGATNIGVLSVLSSKILMAAEQGKPLKEVMSNKKYNRIAAAMIAFGGVCMGVSNWLESKKVVTEWQLGAGKLQRKYNIAENKADGQRTQTAPVNPISSNVPVADASVAQQPQPRNWGTSVQPSGDNFADRKKTAAPNVAAIG